VDHTRGVNPAQHPQQRHGRPPQGLPRRRAPGEKVLPLHELHHQKTRLAAPFGGAAPVVVEPHHAGQIQGQERGDLTPGEGALRVLPQHLHRHEAVTAEGVSRPPHRALVARAEAVLKPVSIGEQRAHRRPQK
jgi:hypothetical protein